MRQNCIQQGLVTSRTAYGQIPDSRPTARLKVSRGDPEVGTEAARPPTWGHPDCVAPFFAQTLEMNELYIESYAGGIVAAFL